MKLRKNLGAKMTALVASLLALGGGWALVHQNPPANADNATTSAAPAASTPATGTRSAAPKPQAVQPTTVKRHVRTHVS
jgi:hypothetical protein